MTDFDFGEEFDEPGIGYTDFDLDALSEAEVDLHDSILQLTFEAALDRSEDDLTDLQLWALAQAVGDFPDEADEATIQRSNERFEGICRKIVASTAAHPAIDYGAIGVSLVEEFMLAERWDDARKFLDEAERHVPQDSRVKDRFLALITILSGDEDKGFGMIQELVAEAEEARDAGLLFAIANDLLSIEMMEDSESILDTVQDMASLDGDDELVEMVNEMREVIAQIYQEISEDEGN
jgi:hypothetical protein